MLRVRHHCTQVRDLKYHHQYGIHQRASGLSRPCLAGGLLLCLGLTRAFDCVDRNDLIRALQHFSISPDLIQLVAHVYRCTSFQFMHRGHTKSFATFRGIRQGCRPAPVLWCLYIGWIMHSFGLQTDMTWMHQHNTLYADDWCLYDLFDSPADLQVLLLRIGKLIVNTKTVAILRMQGSALHPALRKHVMRTSNGTFLCKPRANRPDFHICLVQQHSYLRVILSHSNFEMQTATHRVRHKVNVESHSYKLIYLEL